MSPILPNERVNVLLVDDQPAKLMSLETVLGGLDLNILKAGSADEALQTLLAQDVAVVLVDVCMPGMDGFELAELIRQHPRFQRTAIIFASAVHLTEADRLKGYGLGAVDYIPVPIVPEVLQAKVAIFAELYRKTEQLQRLNRELERRVAERTADVEASAARLRESEKRYRQLIHGLPAAVYMCDAQGRITLYNDAAVTLWGREPALGSDMWCGSWRMYRPDGTPLPPHECPMAVTLREGRAERDQEIIIERPDGTRRNVLSFPEPMFDASGQLIGAINMLTDVTDARRAEETKSLLAAVVTSSDDAIVSKTLEGKITSWNSGAERIFGYTAAEAVGQPITMIIPPERLPEEHEILQRVRRGERSQHFETVRVAKDGQRLDISLTVSPVYDAHGRIIGASKVARDVSDRKRIEALLARDRETLERLVAERTAELELTNERLRAQERMATIGTLSAGLGHDMGNLLLPIRLRLDVIDASDLPASAREDIAAIREACEYLQRLARSLRLLALDPTGENLNDGPTDIAEWWTEVEGMIRNGVSRSTALVTQIPSDLPAVRIGRAALTQIIFNLVQNAGDCLRSRDDGQVSVIVEAAGDDVVHLTVADNGPGMDEETRRRCLEPFFTTKTRGLSTGLGLALVSGIIKRARGSIRLESEPGKGTVFTMVLPVAAPTASDADQAQRRPNLAVVSLDDKRLAAYFESVLASMSFDVRRGNDPDGANVWITQSTSQNDVDAAQRFVDADPSRRAVVIGEDNGSTNAGVLRLAPTLKPSVLRAKIVAVLRTEQPAPEGVA